MSLKFCCCYFHLSSSCYQALSAYKDFGNKPSTARLFLSFPSLQTHCCPSFIFLTKHFWWLCTAYRLRSKVLSMLLTLWPPLNIPPPLPLCPISSYSSHIAYGLATSADVLYSECATYLYATRPLLPWSRLPEMPLIRHNVLLVSSYSIFKTQSRAISSLLCSCYNLSNSTCELLLALS